MFHAPCPACAADATLETNRLSFKAGLELRALLCQRCGHRWLPTDSKIQQLIEKAYGRHYTGFRVDDHFNRIIRGELDERLSKIKSPPASLLDVGCGNGEFLALAVAAGYDACGVDVSTTSRELCEGKGLRAVAGDFLSHEFGRSFDVVTMWDVMEHLQRPDLFVARARDLLRPDGVLVLKIPSKGALNFRVLRVVRRRGGTLLGAPNHIQFFTEASLAEMLRRCGFTEVLWLEHRRFRRPPLTLHPRKILARYLARTVARLAGDENLYVIASKAPFAASALDVLHRRRQRLTA